MMTLSSRILRDHFVAVTDAPGPLAAIGQAAVTTDAQNIIEGHGGTGLGLQFFDFQHRVGGDAHRFPPVRMTANMRMTFQGVRADGSPAAWEARVIAMDEARSRNAETINDNRRQV